MSIQKNKPEQIVTVLRQIEVQMANGKTEVRENLIQEENRSCRSRRTNRNRS